MRRWTRRSARFQIVYHGEDPEPWWVVGGGRVVYRGLTLLESENYVTRWIR